jgi:hypothetical protein
MGWMLMNTCSSPTQESCNCKYVSINQKFNSSSHGHVLNFYSNTITSPLMSESNHSMVPPIRKVSTLKVSDVATQGMTMHWRPLRPLSMFVQFFRGSVPSSISKHFALHANNHYRTVVRRLYKTATVTSSVWMAAYPDFPQVSNAKSQQSLLARY